jgi:hypothetical protein
MQNKQKLELKIHKKLSEQINDKTYKLISKL